MAATRGLQPWRRALHAATGVALVWIPWALDVPRTAVLWLLGAGAMVLLAFDLARLRVPRLNHLFFRAFRVLVSPREAAGVASSTWYVVGALVTYAVFPRSVAMAAVLVLAFADPAAALVGRTWGRRPVGKGSVEGGVAFFAVAAVVLVAVLGTGGAMVLRAVSAAAFTTAVELTPLGLDDNVTVPLAAGAALLLVLGLG